MDIQKIRSWPTYPQVLISLLVIVCVVLGLLAVKARQPLHVLGSASLPPVQLAKSPTVDCRVTACLALTFDDGPHSEVTPAVLDILKRQSVKATFFVLGRQIKGREAILRREHQEGHEIGNHSWDHPNMTKISGDEAANQIERTSRLLADNNVPVPKLLRPPYGAVNDGMLARLNLPIIRWNIDPEDWRHQDPGYLQEHLINTAKAGAIILLHDVYFSTAASLEPILVALKSKYQFVTVSQLLNLTAGEQGQFFSQYH